MGLNAQDVPRNGGKKFAVLDPGSYPARLVGVIDLGLQEQRPFQGEDKPPAREVALTYEFSDEFIKDEDGQDQKDKPRWLTEQLPLHHITSEKARSTKRYKVFDPELKDQGDWVKQITKPVNVTIALNPKKDRVYENISGIAAMRPKDAEKLPSLVNAPLIFDLDAPDLDTWKRVPKWLQDKIKGNLEFDGSKLQKLLGAEPLPPKEEKSKAKVAPKATEDDDKPPY